MNNERSVVLGDEVCRFSSHQNWINKASSWLRGERYIVCIDALGRICQIGKQFMKADTDDAYPVVVYRIEPNQVAQVLNS